MIPDTALMADKLRTCLQESDEVPSDFTRLFKTRYSCYIQVVLSNRYTRPTNIASVNLVISCNKFFFPLF